MLTRSRVLGFVFLLGCGTDETVEAVAAAPPTEPAVSNEACEAGTMAVLASGDCQPVGPKACAEGFERSASGWGCSAIMPAAPCTGSTRAVLGQTSCVPLDDCARAFPPSAANVIVVHDDASLKSALRAAKDGSTIALDAGVYQGIEVPSRLHDLHLAGRCTEKTRVIGGATRGLFASDGAKVSVESLTFDGFDGGIVVTGGAQVTATKVVVRNAQVAFVAGGDGAKLTVDQSVAELTKALADKFVGRALAADEDGTVAFDSSDVRGYPTFTQAAAARAKVIVRRSTLTDLAAGRNSDRVLVLDTGETVFSESAIRFNSGRFASVGRDDTGAAGAAKVGGGSLRLESTTLIHSGGELESQLSRVRGGGNISLEGTTVEHRSIIAWAVAEAGSSLKAKDSVIRSAVKTNTLRMALWVDDGGTADLDGTAIVDAQQHGILVSHRGSKVSLERSLVSDTLAGFTVADPRFGSVGVAVAVVSSATASVGESALVGSSNYSVLAGDNAVVDIQRSIVDATSRSPEGKGGNAIGAFLGTRVAMEDSLVRGSECTALVFSDTGTEGTIKRTRFVGNPSGIILSEVRMVEATDEAQSAVAGQLLMFQNVFEGTDTMVKEEKVPNPLLPSLDP